MRKRASTLAIAICLLATGAHAQITEDAGVPDFWEPTEIKELYDNDERLSRSFMVKGDDGKARGFSYAPRRAYHAPTQSAPRSPRSRSNTAPR